MREIDLTSNNLPVRWQYVKRNLKNIGIEYAFEGFEKQAHRVIQNLIQSSVYEEFDMQIGARKYERNELREDIRKGEYERYFTTTFGTSRINIPRVRENNVKIHYTLFNKYQRRQKKFDEMVVLAMILGLSVRKQEKYFRAFIGDAVSPAKASQLINNFEEGLEKFRTEPIADKYKYLLIDGLWVKVKDGELKDKVILFVLGITFDNKKEIVAFKLAKGETEEEVSSLLNDLYRRGLAGKYLKVVASDGAKGIRSAINMVYPYAKWQLCFVHKLRNLNKNIRHKVKNRGKMIKEASLIYKSETKSEAIERFNSFCHEWQDIEPHAIKCFKDNFYETLQFYDYKDDKNFIASTNHIERDLEEVRRRIKIQGYFRSDRSVNLWVFGIIDQFRRKQQPDDMPDKHVVRIFRNPKFEFAQLS